MNLKRIIGSISNQYRPIFSLFSVLLLTLLLSAIVDNSFFAKVVRVIDGDTIVVLDQNNQQIKIRLEGIDCPESNQDFGTQAKKATSELCFGKKVRIEQSGVDRYGRVLAFVYVGDVCVNEELLKQGMAWHYKKYNQDEILAQLEKTARSLQIGLWNLKEPVEPWKWRNK